MDAAQALFQLKQREVSETRMKKYRSTCRTLARLCGGKLDAALLDMRKMEALSAKIKSSHYQPETRSSLFIVLKMLWKLANGYELEDRPKEIRWIKTHVSRSEMKQPRVITDEEFGKMLSVCNARQKALFSVLMESGPRNSETCAMRKGDVEFVKDGARLHIPSGTKTGPRTILVVDSEPFLAAWLAQHPQKGEDAPLFSGRLGGEVGIASIQKMVREIAKRAGIERRIYVHLFRHTAATRCALYMTEAQMCAYFGWIPGSPMPRRYVHLSGRDTDGAVLRMHNKAAPAKVEDAREPKICVRCRKTNMHDAEMCAYCGRPFDKEKAKLVDLDLQRQLAESRKREMEMLDRITSVELQLKGKRAARSPRKS